MKYWIFSSALFIVSCGTPQAHLPLLTETPIQTTSTPQIIEVTRIVTIEQTVVVTVTPNPPLAQECLNTAMTQLELNGCAALERDLAKAELEKLISEIKFSSLEEKQAFEELQAEWETQIEKDCEFFYGQLYTDDNGNLHYKWGSMAPMQWGFCIAEQYKRRIEDLKFAYITGGETR